MKKLLQVHKDQLHNRELNLETLKRKLETDTNYYLAVKSEVKFYEMQIHEARSKGLREFDSQDFIPKAKPKPDTALLVALQTLHDALAAQPDYAHGWHCNLAMSFLDAERSNAGQKNMHEVCNDGASRFMRAAFNITTSNDMLEKDYDR